MQNQKRTRTYERTNGRTDGVTLSLLELLIAAKKVLDSDTNTETTTLLFEMLRYKLKIKFNLFKLSGAPMPKFCLSVGWLVCQ